MKQVALKCADLGHLASPRTVHRKWVHLLEEVSERRVIGHGIWGHVCDATSRPTGQANWTGQLDSSAEIRGCSCCRRCVYHSSHIHGHFLINTTHPQSHQQLRDECFTSRIHQTAEMLRIMRISNMRGHTYCDLHHITGAFRHQYFILLLLAPACMHHFKLAIPFQIISIW
jgi:hypothetical protein